MNLRVLDTRTPQGLVFSPGERFPYVPIYFPEPGKNLFHPVFCEELTGSQLDAKPGDLIRIFTQVSLSILPYKKTQVFASVIVVSSPWPRLTRVASLEGSARLTCDPGENLKSPDADLNSDGKPDGDHGNKYRTLTRGASFVVEKAGPLWVVAYVFVRANGSLTTDFIKCNPTDYCQLTIERIGP